MKLSLRFLLLLGCGAAALLAEDFWVKKPFTEWNQKELSKLASDSPWAKEVAVPLSGGGRGARGGGGGGGDTGGDASGGGARGGGGGGRRGGGGGGSSDGSDSPGAVQVPAASVVIRWQTALPIRQAIIMNRFGAEKAASEDAKKALAQEPANYVVALIGLPANMLQGAAETMKAGTSLVIKGKDAIPAENIQAQTRGQVADVFIFFSKKAPVALEDKEVEFNCKFGRTEIQKKFKLKDMVVAGKLEM